MKNQTVYFVVLILIAIISALIVGRVFSPSLSSSISPSSSESPSLSPSIGPSASASPSISPSIGTKSGNLVIKKDFESLPVNTVLGQEYIERQYKAFPLSSMVRSEAIQYGTKFKVDATVIQFNQSANKVLQEVLPIYLSRDWERSPVTQVYELYEKKNPSHVLVIWTSGDYLIVIDSNNGMGGSSESIVGAYFKKYPINR